jgi:hypothetical protein
VLAHALQPAIAISGRQSMCRTHVLAMGLCAGIEGAAILAFDALEGDIRGQRVWTGRQCLGVQGKTAGVLWVAT